MLQAKFWLLLFLVGAPRGADADDDSHDDHDDQDDPNGRGKDHH